LKDKVGGTTEEKGDEKVERRASGKIGKRAVPPSGGVEITAQKGRGKVLRESGEDENLF